MKTPIVTDRFSIHKIKGTISNIYLVESESGFLLIDPGVSSDISCIRKYMQVNLNKDISDVKLSIVTHMHPDHSGGASELRKLFNIPIASHHKTGRWYAGLGGNLQYYFDRFMTIGVALRQSRKIGSVRFDRVLNPDYPLFGGEKIPFFADWTTTFVPGHTTHDIVLYNKNEKILFAADLIISVRDNCFDLPMPIISPKRIRKSYDILSELDIDIICLVHGEPFRPDDSSMLFNELKDKTYEPLTKLSKRVHMLSFYSHEIIKTYIKDFIKCLPNLAAKGQ